MQSADSSEQKAKLEVYKQACEDHRFFGDMRFKQLSLFSLITGVLLNVLRTKNTALGIVSLSAIGMATTVVLWIMEVRSSCHGQSARTVKRRFEQDIICIIEGKKPSTTHWDFSPRWTLVNATNAVLAFYTASFLFWLALFLKEQSLRSRWVFGMLFSLVLAALMLFSAREYRHLLRHGLKTWRW